MSFPGRQGECVFWRVGFRRGHTDAMQRYVLYTTVAHTLG